MTWSVKGALAVGGAVVGLGIGLLWGTSSESRASPASARSVNTGERDIGVPARTAVDTRVVILDFEFRPAAVTVRVGDTITWFNQGPTVHTATSDQQGVFDTDLLFAGQSATIALRSPGTFGYFCAVHPFMRGTVTVTGTAPTVTPTTVSATPTTVAASPTPTATVTPAPTTGGRELTLRAGAGGLVTLTWAGGTAQTGYVLWRFGAGGVAPVPLGAQATRYEDMAGVAEGATCYLLAPVQGDRELALSDLLCAVRRIAAGSGPGEVAVRFETPQSARLTWTPVQGTDLYAVVGLPQGSGFVSGSVTTATIPFSVPTCFFVVALQSGAPTGISNGVCAWPGVGNLR